MTNKYQVMLSDWVSGVKAEIFLFSFMTTLRAYNNEVLIDYFVSKLRYMCPPKDPDNFIVVSMSPGSCPSLCSHFPMLLLWKVAHPIYQLGISLTHGHSLGNMRLANGVVLHPPPPPPPPSKQ